MSNRLTPCPAFCKLSVKDYMDYCLININLLEKKTSCEALHLCLAFFTPFLHKIVFATWVLLAFGNNIGIYECLNEMYVRKFLHSHFEMDVFRHLPLVTSRSRLCLRQRCILMDKKHFVFAVQANMVDLLFPVGSFHELLYSLTFQPMDLYPKRAVLDPKKI